MSTLRANIIDSTSTTEFKDTITANGDKQWVDSYGVIKTNRATINEDITIPTGTNGLSTGPVSGCAYANHPQSSGHRPCP